MLWNMNINKWSGVRTLLLNCTTLEWKLHPMDWQEVATVLWEMWKFWRNFCRAYEPKIYFNISGSWYNILVSYLFDWKVMRFCWIHMMIHLYKLSRISSINNKPSSHLRQPQSYSYCLNIPIHHKYIVNYFYSVHTWDKTLEWNDFYLCIWNICALRHATRHHRTFWYPSW